MIPRFTVVHRIPYENQIVILISILASLRILLGVLLDIVQGTVTASELTLDLLFLLIFAGVLFYTSRGTAIRNINPAFGIVLIVLLGINFYQFGGTNGFSEYNYLSGIMVTIMLFSGAWLTRLLVFQVVFIVMLVLAHRFFPDPINRVFLVTITNDPFDFIFSLFSILVLTYYLKLITKREIRKVGKLNDLLLQKVKLAKEQNHLLIERSLQLKRAKDKLESQIHERTAHLTIQNTALENYIEYNTMHLQEPLERLLNVANRLESKSPLGEMTTASCQDLSKVIQSIKASLENDGVVTRSKVS